MNHWLVFQEMKPRKYYIYDLNREIQEHKHRYKYMSIHIRK